MCKTAKTAMTEAVPQAKVAMVVVAVAAVAMVEVARGEVTRDLASSVVMLARGHRMLTRCYTHS